MAKTESTMLALGTPAPDFELPDTEGETYRLADFADAEGLVVVFMCNHCPFVKHIADGLADFARDYSGKGIAVVAINANDVETHPDDAPEHMREEKSRRGYRFPYLFDATQNVAKAYGAACTPDFFLFDQDQRLVYRGRFDASSPGKHDSVTGEDLRRAADAVLSGRDVPNEQYPSMGCNIKWKPGNAPDYSV